MNSKEGEANRDPADNGDQAPSVVGGKVEPVPSKLNPKAKNPLLANRKEKKYFDSADWELTHQKK